MLHEARDGGVCVLRLDRPPANAIDETLLADLAAALDTARADDAVRAVVLTGTGRFFSAGFDFAAPRRDAAAEQRISALYREAHVKLLTLPKPTIAMMNGHAVAGGLVMVLACDCRFGIDGVYRVGLTEVAVGAAFPRAAFEIVRLRLPQARATELLLGAVLYPASAAVRLGIIDELVPPNVFETTVLRHATRLAGMPREAYAHAKALLVADAAAHVASESAEDAQQMLAVWSAPESRAARARQREKLGLKS